MSSQDSKRITHLLTLADLAQDMPTVYLKLSNYWDALRQDMGLAKLLLTIQTYIKNETVPLSTQTTDHLTH